MKKYLFAFVVLLLALGQGISFAQDDADDADNVPSQSKDNPPPQYSKDNPPPRVYGAHPRGVFAFPGKACPPGSRLYTGPELKEIEKLGAVYCLFNRRYAWFHKIPGMTKCPGGAAPVEGDSTAPPDVMWCDMPNAVFSANGLFMTADPAFQADMPKYREQNTEKPKIKTSGDGLDPEAIAKYAPPSQIKRPIDSGKLPDLLKDAKPEPPPVAVLPARSAATAAPIGTPVTASTSAPKLLPVSTSSAQPISMSAPEPVSKSVFGGFVNWLKQL